MDSIVDIGELVPQPDVGSGNEICHVYKIPPELWEKYGVKTAVCTRCGEVLPTVKFPRPRAGMARGEVCVNCLPAGKRKPAKQRGSWTPKMTDHALRMREAGRSLHSIAEALGVSYGCLCYHLNDIRNQELLRQQRKLR